MEWFSVEWWSVLFSIIIIDLLLAGDNAIVIGMAARNVPQHQQKKAILWGTVGAIGIRALATAVVVWLLKIPGLLLIGGLLLLWIAYKLLAGEKEHDISAKDSLLAAIRTIVIADGIMGLDNVLAVAGASHGDFWLVLIGLAISIPIVIWGSTLFLKLIGKFPAIIYIGSGILAFTAAKMITGEPMLSAFFSDKGWLKWLLVAVSVLAVLALGRFTQLKRRNEPARA
jgi:YjbE family integral membrane protein